MRIAKWASLILLVSLANFIARPQQQQVAPSDQSQQNGAATAARQNRELKKDQPKASKVWDNDNIPATGRQINVVGQTSEGAAAAGEQQVEASATAAEQEQAAPATPEEKAALQSSLDSAKRSLDNLKADLDIQQRKYTLDQQTYYGKTNYASDKAGAATLKSEKDQMDAKQEEVAAAEKKMQELQSKLDAAKGQQSGAAK